MKRIALHTAHLCATVLLIGSWAPAMAQDAKPSLSLDDANANDAIIVTATLSGEGVKRDLIGSSVTLIDDQDLEDRETRIVSDVLRDVPGLAVSRAGAVGGLTQVRVRGTESNHVLTLIDGIKVSDPYQGEFDWATLIADDAARIEVLRGQQSSLYGSDAIGGVINYITLSGREAPGIRLRAEGGSFGAHDGTARVAGMGGNQFDYALSAVYNSTDGYPTAPGGTRNVGSENIGASAKINWTPSSYVKVTGVLRYSFTKGDSDDQGITTNSPVISGRQIQTVIDTPRSYYNNGAWYGLVRAEVQLLDGHLTSALSGQFADTYRDAYASYGYSYGDKGTRYKGSFENTLNFGDDHVKQALTLALDLESEQFHNVDPTGYADTSQHVLNTVGLVGQYRLTVDDRFAITGSVRQNWNDYFDDDTTWHADATYNLPTGARLHIAAGTGTKNPGAFELFDYSSGQYIGNPNLKPEHSQGWEAGVDQSFLHGAVTIGATYFNSRLKNEIYTDYPPPDYIATSLNRTTVTHQEGVEMFGQARIGALRIDTSYTFLNAPQSRNVLLYPTDPSSFATGPVWTQAVRRPKNIASLNLTYAPSAVPLSTTLTIRYNGAMKDVVFDADYSAMFADLPAFTLVDLAVRYDISKTLQIYARADNLFDEKYQEVFTFQSPGRTVYGGLRARF